MLKALIVDDEQKARDILLFQINHYLPEISEVEMAANVGDALQRIQTFKPDIVFLDIVMPRQDGFDLLSALNDWDFDVIFTTAYDQYAIKAIRFSALDYLMKPVDPDELRAALDRYLEKRDNKPAQKALYRNLLDNLQSPQENEFKLAIATTDGTYFFRTPDIIRCGANPKYTLFHLTQNRRDVSAKTQKEYEEVLGNQGFLRVHKSHLVNLTCIADFLGKDHIRLKDGTEIEVARRRKDEVRQILMNRAN